MGGEVLVAGGIGAIRVESETACDSGRDAKPSNGVIWRSRGQRHDRIRVAFGATWRVSKRAVRFDTRRPKKATMRCSRPQLQQAAGGLSFDGFCTAVAREVIPPRRATPRVRQYNHSKFQRSAM